MANGKKKLTPKEKLFRDRYLANGFNATQAAISAGYSKKTARNIGCNLLTKVHIRESVMAQMDQYGPVAQIVLKELINIATADLADYVNVGEGGELVCKAFSELEEGKTGAVKKIKEKSMITESKDGEKIYKTSSIQYELHDKQKALDTLGKVMKLFTDRIDITSNNNELRPMHFVIVKDDPKHS